MYWFMEEGMMDYITLKLKRTKDLKVYSPSLSPDELEAKLEQLNEQHVQAIEELNTQHQQAIANQQAQHEAEVAELNAEHAQAIEQLEAELNEEHQQAIEQLNNQHSIAIGQLEAQHAQAIEELNEQHTQAIANQQAQHEAEVAELNAEIEDLRSKLENGGGVLKLPDGMKFQGTTSTSLFEGYEIDTSAMTTMEQMMYGCSGLTSLDVSKWDVSNVTSLNRTFYGCTKLTELDVSKWDTRKNTTLYYTFYNCQKLETLPIENWNVSNVTDMQYTFYLAKLNKHNLSSWDVSKVNTFYYTFYNTNVEELNLSGWDLKSCTNLYGMFSSCRNLKTLNLSGWKNTSGVTKMDNLFYYCTSLGDVDLSGINTQSVTSMTQTFYYCRMPNYNIKHWDVSKVSSFNSMFSSAYSKNTLDLSGWNTSALTNIQYLLQSSYFTEIDLSGWNVNKVTTASYAFNNAYMKKLNLNGWVFNNSISYLTSFFQGCDHLTTLWWNGLGSGQKITAIAIAQSPLGTGSDEAREALTYTINNAYDRASAGWSACKITFSSTTKALLTDEEKAILTSRGFTIA